MRPGVSTQKISLEGEHDSLSLQVGHFGRDVNPLAKDRSYLEMDSGVSVNFLWVAIYVLVDAVFLMGRPLSGLL